MVVQGTRYTSSGKDGMISRFMRCQTKICVSQLEQFNAEKVPRHFGTEAEGLRLGKLMVWNVIHGLFFTGHVYFPRGFFVGSQKSCGRQKKGR